jgi:hypothetical protein
MMKGAVGEALRAVLNLLHFMHKKYIEELGKKSHPELSCV